MSAKTEKYADDPKRAKLEAERAARARKKEVKDKREQQEKAIAELQRQISELHQKQTDLFSHADDDARKRAIIKLKDSLADAECRVSDWTRTRDGLRARLAQLEDDKSAEQRREELLQVRADLKKLQTRMMLLKKPALAAKLRAGLAAIEQQRMEEGDDDAS